LREIGELFNMDYTSVSMMAKRFKEKANGDKETSEMIKKIMERMGENECEM